MALEIRHRPISVADYHKMFEAGVFRLVDRVVLVFSDLADGEYNSTRVARPGENIACSAFPGDPIPVSDIIL